MSRVDTTQDVVLQRVAARLRDQLDLNNRQCYETLQAEAPWLLPKGGAYYVTVSPGEGQFEAGEQQVANVTENWDVIVTAYARIVLDSAGHAEKLLREQTRGLLVRKREILKALVGHDLTDAAGNTFLRQLFFAQRSGRPQFDQNERIAFLSITFGVDFDWDLES